MSVSAIVGATVYIAPACSAPASVITTVVVRVARLCVNEIASSLSAESAVLTGSATLGISAAATPSTVTGSAPLVIVGGSSRSAKTSVTVVRSARCAPGVPGSESAMSALAGRIDGASGALVSTVTGSGGRAGGKAATRPVVRTVAASPGVAAACESVSTPPMSTQNSSGPSGVVAPTVSSCDHDARSAPAVMSTPEDIASCSLIDGVVPAGSAASRPTRTVIAYPSPAVRWPESSAMPPPSAMSMARAVTRGGGSDPIPSAAVADRSGMRLRASSARPAGAAGSVYETAGVSSAPRFPASSSVIARVRSRSSSGEGSSTSLPSTSVGAPFSSRTGLGGGAGPVVGPAPGRRAVGVAPSTSQSPTDVDPTTGSSNSMAILFGTTVVAVNDGDVVSTPALRSAERALPE